ncbi:alpha-latrocrustotoxin-Lt1a-like [Cucurbita pepo subsp. pepo]|uniref:alpha-latrocrustotoxin-Lt1a-like n=1 Tax=Cucurbita pepo subsp. pepo TaxID=3664 RepID=UPI000C9D3FBB|nr:alpha-latrocrustotoxin-Lt1a-like [Cucurbita pepo subsp. pepo]
MEANGENNELRLAISSFEESKRKLYEASKIGSIQSLKTLIRGDPNIIQRVLISSSNAESPLHVSVLHHHLEFTRFLLNLVPELAGEVDDLQRTPLHLASENGTVEIVQALLEKNTSTCMVRDLNGWIPLHHAVINGRIDIMQRLIIARSRSPWIKLHNGQTVLHLCVKHNHLEALKFFITMIKDPQDYGFLNQGDENENTILDFSMILRRIEIVQYLLSIPGIKTGTNMAKNCATSNEKESPSRTQEQCDKKLSISLTFRKFIRSLWMKNLEYKGDWFQDVQGTMMLVATVIATVAFQGAINPPGGVWQENIPFNSNSTIHRLFHSSNTLKTFIAGTAVMAYPTSDQGNSYTGYLVTNSISFFASICVIMFIIGRLPLKNRICAWMLTVTMCIAIASLSQSYLMGVWMVNVSYRKSDALKIAWYISLATVGAVFLCCIMIPFLLLVVKLLVWAVKRSKL